MKAVVLKSPQNLKVEEIPEPTLDNGEVLVKVKACGICGSDLRYLAGENPWALHTLGEDRENPPNIILGHEFAGEVVAVKDENFDYLLGKRVGVMAFKGCGVCQFCRSGKENLCKDTLHLGHSAGWGNRKYFPGGMAKYCQVWGTHCFELPDNVSYEQAATLDFMAVATHAVKLSKISIGETVAVIGCGPVGLSIARIAEVYGADAIYCFDTYNLPLEMAERSTITDTLNVNNCKIGDFIEDKTKGRGVDVVFDTVGSTKTQSDALDILAPAGRLINLVANFQKANYDLIDLSSERSIMSSANNLYADFPDALQLLASERITVTDMITHKFNIDDTIKAFQILENKQENDAFKVMILP